MIKKSIMMASVIMVMATLFSLSAFAAQTEITQADEPKTATVDLSAEIDDNTTYTVSIPSGTYTVLNQTTPQTVGTISCSAFSTNSGKKVVVSTSATGTLTGAATVNYNVTGYNYEFTNATGGGNVQITLDTLLPAAGNYSGTMTFTVAAESAS